MKNLSLFPPAATLEALPTPCYLYDTALLEETLKVAQCEAAKYDYEIHYAVKANFNHRILQQIAAHGLGADCVSGGEIQAALDAGFPAGKIVYAGVGKADWEMELALEKNIFCFNVESLAELEALNELAGKRRQVAPVALRINPDIIANTHRHIITGFKENKFGINLDLLDEVLNSLPALKNIALKGIHFHIGSQITDMENFRSLCFRANEIQERLAGMGLLPEHVNLGGGLGIDYHAPEEKRIAGFATFFRLFDEHLKRYSQQHIHFELGRSLVGQCGTLLSRVLYVKKGSAKKFAIIDAGMTELIRPALYEAYHKIENITSGGGVEQYDVVGPVCESTDSFGKDVPLNKVSRNDLLVIYSAGAYGESMSSHYNCRQLRKPYFYGK
ncbi:MAG: diaminopimelate decarboxylase [Prevotellaceae bacterium]|jgi:diaminopimelate decarboxylase|nr:diaminopimelate decarboxylase [Prevotellaceae bacterium]